MSTLNVTPVMSVIELPATMLPSLSYLQVFLIMVVIGMLFVFAPSFNVFADDYLKDIPLVNSAKSFSFSHSQTKRVFMKSSKQIMSEAKKLYPDRLFRIITDWGELIILPSTFANEIRNEPKLSFGMAIHQDNHASLPGFEPVRLVGRNDQLIQHVARKQLTKHLASVIEPLSRETKHALHVNFGESEEWEERHLKTVIMDIIARLSSRIYLGEELCRNEEWLKITKAYTKSFFYASVDLRTWPKSLRPIAQWFTPNCKVLRSEVSKARRIIGDLVERRTKVKREALAAGKPMPVFADALEWASQEAASKGVAYDPAVFQLTLSLLAIHTTFDLLEQCMLDLAENPQFMQPLRNEIVEVLTAEGWKKTALYNMKLLDSAIKESQRLKPGTIASMRRYVVSDLKLSNGFVLKKGMRINVDSSRMWDPELHPEPEKYDAFRFLRLRSQPGREHMAQLVATSVDHLGFGHGDHSCPGRFFAANEIKVALCHILLKYDWKLADEADTKPDVLGMIAKSNPTARILIRKRAHPELDVDSI